MKKSLFLSVFYLMGCSHVTEKKVAMELPFAPELVEQMQKNVDRAPASLTEFEIEGKSPRRVYFTALYHQYLTMGEHLNEANQDFSCPQFHHDKIETDAVSTPKLTLFKASDLVYSDKEYFPELAFSKSFSLKDHYEEIKGEISTLCEEGVSDNYYKFDNLVIHYAAKKSFHQRPDSMKSVLKIPVFANYYLLKMLQPPHSLVLAHPEEKRVISMTRTHWFEKYVNEAQRLRNNLIKNAMVKR